MLVGGLVEPHPSLKDAKGSLYTFTTDPAGALTGVATPIANRTMALARDTFSRVRLTRSVRGGQDSIHYDTLGYVTRTRNLYTGRAQDITYETSTVAGILVNVGPKDLRNNVNDPQPSYRYSGVRLRTRFLYPDSANRDSFFIRTDGRPDSVVDMGGHKTRYIYSTAPTNPYHNNDTIVSGKDTTRLVHDLFGRLRQVIQGPAGRDSTQYILDSRGRLLTLIRPAPGDTTRFSYDQIFLTQVTDAKGQTYGFGYNGAGWDTVRVDPRGNRDVYLYDANGNLGRWANRNGDTIRFTHDAVDRVLTRIAAPEQATWSYTYNDSLLTAQNTASTDSMRFDSAGRLVSSASGRGAVSYGVTYTYNAADRITGMTLSPSAHTVDFRYNLRTGMRDSIRTSAMPGWLTIGRTSERLLSTVTFPTSTSPALQLNELPGTTYPYSHRPGGKEFNLATPDVTLGINIQQDTQGRVSKVFFRGVDRLDSLRSYKYDRKGQLDSAVWYRRYPNTGSCSQSVYFGTECPNPDSLKIREVFAFFYDLVGNFADTASRGDLTTLGNRMLRVRTDNDNTVDTLTYDSAGNMIRRQTIGGSLDQRFKWNALGQLEWTVIPPETTFYSYDTWGRRVRKRIKNGSSVQDTAFVWDGNLLLAEYRGSTLSDAYTYYPGTHVPLTRARSGSPYYYVTDEADNVVGMLDGNATIQWLRRSWPFGYAEQSSNIPNPFGFKASYEDPNTYLQYMMNRYYDWRTRRFISEDPIGLAGGINPYVYADNDPINSSDPTGLQAHCVWDEDHWVCPPIVGATPRWPFSTPRESGATSRFGNRGSGIPGSSGIPGGSGISSAGPQHRLTPAPTDFRDRYPCTIAGGALGLSALGDVGVAASWVTVGVLGAAPRGLLGAIMSGNPTNRTFARATGTFAAGFFTDVAVDVATERQRTFGDFLKETALYALPVFSATRQNFTDWRSACRI